MTIGNKPSCIAIIPARGGSKGVPRKNVLPLAGRPLIAWTIEAARRANSVGRVVVSTDDAEIERVALQYGAEVVHRPAEISGDTATSESALIHTLHHLRQSENYRPEHLVFLQCTSPLTSHEDIDGTLAALRDQQADSALSVARFYHFLWRADSNSAQGVNHDKAVRQRRQDRQPEYLETGAVYAMKTDGFLAAGHRFFGKTAVHDVPAERSIEIDEPHDFAVAELLLRQRERGRRKYAIPSPLHAVVFDFDGVMTDNRVWVAENGQEAVACNRSDGLGLNMLAKAGIKMLVLSKEKNPVVSARCKKLTLECIQGCDDKLPALMEWMKKNSLNAGQVIYVGNDVNDLACMRAVGCPVAVGDALPEVLPAARIVLEARGGHGAVRELCDLILEK